MYSFKVIIYEYCQVVKWLALLSIKFAFIHSIFIVVQSNAFHSTKIQKPKKLPTLMLIDCSSSEMQSEKSGVCHLARPLSISRQSLVATPEYLAGHSTFAKTPGPALFHPTPPMPLTSVAHHGTIERFNISIRTLLDTEATLPCT